MNQEGLPMGAKDVLVRARGILEDRKRWTKHVFARDKDGNEVYCLSDEAYSFCLSGAINRAASMLTTSGPERVFLINDAERALKPDVNVPLDHFNDYLDHETGNEFCVELIDMALRRLELADMVRGAKDE